jgi:hypothetical protein
LEERDQIRAALKSAPLIEIAATAEKRRLAK